MDVLGNLSKMSSRIDENGARIVLEDDCDDENYDLEENWNGFTNIE